MCIRKVNRPLLSKLNSLFTKLKINFRSKTVNQRDRRSKRADKFSKAWLSRFLGGAGKFSGPFQYSMLEQ